MARKKRVVTEDEKSRIRKEWLEGENSFTGAVAFAKSVKAKFPSIPQTTIVDVVQSTYPYSMYRQTRSNPKFTSRIIMTEPRIGAVVGSDVMFFENWLVLAFLDFYSRKLFLYVYRRLSAAKVAAALEEVHHQLGGFIRILYTGKFLITMSLHHFFYKFKPFM